MLNRMEIPYKYEAPLQIGSNLTVYPDFTILNVSLRKELIWEHFGMMDDADYCQNVLLKINTYREHNYFEGDNLITSFESLTQPIRTKQIEEMIKHYI